MKKNPLYALLFAWLLPGAGHWYIGQRYKAGLFLVLILGVFVAGLAINTGSVNARPVGMLKYCVAFVTRDPAWAATIDTGRHAVAFLLQACTGLPAGVALISTSACEEIPASKMSDFGMLLTLMAGSLNVLVMTDALYRAAPEAEK